MNRIAYLITNADTGTTAGDMTLVLRRAKAMHKECGFFTKIFAYKGEQKKERCDEYYSVQVVTCMKSVINEMISESPDVAIIYGHKIELFAKRIRKTILRNNLKTKIIIDVQATVREKYEYGGIKAKALYPLYKYAFSSALNHADAAFVVSDELMIDCESYHSKANELRYFKIRCGTEFVPTKKQIDNNRRDIRSRNGIGDDSVVFVYSGYRLPWQKIDEIINHFKKYDILIDNAFFLFLCNIDDEFESLLSSSFPKGNYRALLLSQDDYIRWLCACDVGYILRDYNSTNTVAFPNKFSDYLAAGLLIAINDALPEPVRLLKGNDLKYIDSCNQNYSENLLIIKEYLSEKTDYVQKTRDVCNKELLYTNQVKMIDY